MNLQRALSVPRQPYVRMGLWAAATVGIVISLLISFQAGCTGDVKTMAAGDVGRALQLEEYAFVMALVSAVLGAAAFCQTLSSAYRDILGCVFAFFLFACLWVAGMQAELQGMRSCFN